MDEIPWCNHSNEVSLTILSHGSTCLVGFEKLKIVIFLELLIWPLLGVKGLKYLKRHCHGGFAVLGQNCVKIVT